MIDSIEAADPGELGRAPRHFVFRCRDRGVVSVDPEFLWRGLRWAIENDRADLVERVKTHRDVEFWRFRCPDGIFYAVVPVGTACAITVYDQITMRKKKAALKRAKKKFASRIAVKQRKENGND